MCEKRFAKKVTSLTLDQAYECAALLRMSKDLPCDSCEGAASYR